MPARQRTADPAAVEAALARVLAGPGSASGDDLRLLTRHFLATLSAAAPGRSVEVRVPPYGVAQCVPGARHTRGNPPAVVETDALSWILLAVGRLSWAQARSDGRVFASGERSDLSALLPLTEP